METAVTPVDTVLVPLSRDGTHRARCQIQMMFNLLGDFPASGNWYICAKEFNKLMHLTNGNTSAAEGFSSITQELGDILGAGFAAGLELPPSQATEPMPPMEVLVSQPLEESFQLVALRKRRLQRGASKSDEMFREMHRIQRGTSFSSLQDAPQAEPQEVISILGQTRRLRDQVVSRVQGWSDHLIRVAIATLVVYITRITDMVLREHVMLIWIIEGETFMRAHKGTCYIYEAAGAFVPYRGIPPKGTFHRVKNFLLELEGIFRLLPLNVRRENQAIIAAMGQLLREHENEAALLNACKDASILHGGERRIQKGGKGDHADFHDLAQGSSAWTMYVAQGMSRVGLQIQRELLDEKIINYFIEWCETPSQKAPAVAYEDVCFVYRDAENTCMTRVGRSPANHIYIVIPHALCDPVLESVIAEVEKFYSQTFWCNVEAFRCNQAALDLAKRGENVDRCFFGISPGGGANLCTLPTSRRSTATTTHILTQVCGITMTS